MPPPIEDRPDAGAKRRQPELISGIEFKGEIDEAADVSSIPDIQLENLHRIRYIYTREGAGIQSGSPKRAGDDAAAKLSRPTASN
jgi:hypothetical protein